LKIKLAALELSTKTKNIVIGVLAATVVTETIIIIVK
jgi:hypothetical protein